MAEDAPRIEVVLLGGLGTLLVFLNALVLLGAAENGTAPIQFTADAGTAGSVGLLLAFLLTIFLVMYWVADDADVRGVWATLFAVMGAFSLWVGGGFIVGCVLSFTAGVLGVVLARLPAIPRSSRSSSRDRPSPEESVVGPRSLSALGTDSVTSSNRAMLVWYCPKCDAENPVDARVCKTCGAPVAGRT